MEHGLKREVRQLLAAGWLKIKIIDHNRNKKYINILFYLWLECLIKEKHILHINKFIYIIYPFWKLPSRALPLLVDNHAKIYFFLSLL